jgi:hypothetical protein
MLPIFIGHSMYLMNILRIYLVYSQENSPNFVDRLMNFTLDFIPSYIPFTSPNFMMRKTGIGSNRLHVDCTVRCRKAC